MGSYLLNSCLRSMSWSSGTPRRGPDRPCRSRYRPRHREVVDIAYVVGQVADAVLSAGLLAAQRPQLGGGRVQVVVHANNLAN